MAWTGASAQPAVVPVIFTSPLENSDLELRVTVTASVPGESNHDVVGPRGVEPRTVGARAVEPRPVELRPGKGAFPRSARLLRHADFERVYKQGRRHFSASMTVFYWQRPQADVAVAKGSAAKPPVAPGLRIGFTVSRALGGAVQRNRMKRRLREAVRFTRPPAGPDADVVINPKKSLLATDFAAVVNEVGRAFVVIEEKLAGKTGTVARTEQKSSGSRKPKA